MNFIKPFFFCQKCLGRIQENIQSGVHFRNQLMLLQIRYQVFDVGSKIIIIINSVFQKHSLTNHFDQHFWFVECCSRPHYPLFLVGCRRLSAIVFLVFAQHQPQKKNVYVIRLCRVACQNVFKRVTLDLGCFRSPITFNI